MSTDMKIIEAKKLTKIYKGGILAVDHIDLDVIKGEIFGFLGPNGAGKTTTVKMFVTLIRPTDGRAYVDGINVIENPEEVRKRIGYVPQELTADDELTGFENMLIQARLYGLSKSEARERAKELLKLVDLYEAADRIVRKYSGGMRRRLELVMGLLHEPKILFLDEPTLGLDVQSRTAIWNYIQSIRKERDVTIFLTTHYMEEADILSDRLAIIDRGKIVARGSPIELKNKIGGDIITIKVKEDNLDVNSLLSNIDSVVSIKKVDEGEYAIKVNRGEEVLPDIIKAIIMSGVEIRYVSLEKPSLNQVFLEFTGRKLREESLDIFKTRAIMMRRAR